MWFFRIKDNIKVIIPPKISGLEVCLFDLYQSIAGYGGYEVITIDGLWNEIVQSFGFPGYYGEAFNRLFIDYLLHPHEYFVFAQKWYGKYTSIKGCEENDGVGTSVGRSTRGLVRKTGTTSRP